MFLKKLKIKASKLFNMVDTTLLPQKEHKNITQKDFDIHRVTKRKTEYICGYKGLVFLNRQGFIIDCEFLNINISDYNILKKTRKIRKIPYWFSFSR